MRKRTPPQKLISESRARFNVAVWGRQSGKTTFGLDKMTYRPLQGRPGGIYWYILQTYSAAEVAFKRFYYMHRDSGLLASKPNFSDFFFTLKNKSILFFKSGEVFEDLRVETLDGCAIDEYRQQKAGLWSRVIRPMLARHKAWCDFYSTPNGFDHFYELYEFAQNHPDEWATFHAPSSQAFWWTQAELDSARSSMSLMEYEQEIEAEFRDLTSGKAYGSYGTYNERRTSPFTDSGIIHKNLPVYLCLDFNNSPMAWTLVQGAVKNFYAFDMVYLPRTTRGTFEAADYLVEKLQFYNIKHITIVGDASGKAQRSSSAGETDYSIIYHALREAKIDFEDLTPESNPAIKDRVNCFNAHLKNAKGSVHFWLHPENCKALRSDMQKQTWKPGIPKLHDGPNKELGHAADGVGYMLCVVDPLKSFEDSFDLAVI